MSCMVIILLRSLTPSPACGGGCGGGGEREAPPTPDPSPPLASLAGGGGKRSHPLQIEIRLLPRPVARQRAFGTDRIRPLEDPVLPGGQPREDFRLHRLRAS